MSYKYFSINRAHYILSVDIPARKRVNSFYNPPIIFTKTPHFSVFRKKKAKTHSIFYCFLRDTPQVTDLNPFLISFQLVSHDGSEDGNSQTRIRETSALAKGVGVFIFSLESGWFCLFECFFSLLKFFSSGNLNPHTVTISEHTSCAGSFMY